MKGGADPSTNCTDWPHSILTVNAIEAIIPFDPLIADYDAKGIPIADLPADSPAVIAVRRLVAKLL